VKEDTACFWAWKEKWELPQVFAPLRNAIKQASSNAHAAISEVITEQGEDSRLYLSAAGLKAAHHAAKLNGHHLLTKETSQALLNTARTADVVHGYTASRQQGVSVQIANVIQPTPEEKAERQAMFAKLEEITRRLAAPPA
jgi:hypothetical protein